MSTKEALRQLRQLFSPPSTSAASPFHALSLPADAAAQIDSLLSQFAASFPLGGGGGHHRESEGEKERARWREGLLEIWAVVEPLPGTEGEPVVIARVSAFLVLLEKLSAGLGEDDDSALISRKDVGTVWWSAVLRRTMLGTAPERTHRGAGERGRKGSKLPPGFDSSSMRPLTTSRVALQAATAMVVWSMAPSLNVPDHLADVITPFGQVVVNEFEERATAMLSGHNEGYGVRNLEECIIGWGQNCPKAFFLHISSAILPMSRCRLASLSVLLAYLSRHSGKAYHALRTPLLNRLNTLCLESTSPADISLAIKCLAIFLVSLPVIIGEPLIGVMAVYGRMVCWEHLGDASDTPEREKTEAEADVVQNDPASDGPPPNPLVLFTVLYGLYPCNFVAFLKDAQAYLRGKEWKGDLAYDSNLVRERSKIHVRLHTLHPALLTSDLATELTDTNRWRQLESADVMAECDRNLVHVGEPRDPRGETLESDVGDEPTYFDSGGGAQLVEAALEAVQQEVAKDQHARIRALSHSPQLSGSRSRSPTPHLPSHTHFTNFQALQSSPTRRPTSVDPDYVDPLSLSAQLGMATSPTGSAIASTVTSRRGSFADSRLTPGASYLSRSNSKGHPASSNAQIVRLETELVLLQSEVNFQTYLKQLHLAHMGTLHREKVLESGAEAERQSLYRTIRTLRAQLKQTKTTLDKLRVESSVTKANWIAHIDDLKDKLKSLREHRVSKEDESASLLSELSEAKGIVSKQAKELEEQGAAFFDLRNQVSLDSIKLLRISEYESRIEALMRTLAICDEDLCKYVENRRQTDTLVGEWKKADLLREASQAQTNELKMLLNEREDEMVQLQVRLAAKAAVPIAPTGGRDDMATLRRELDRLRARALAAEEEIVTLREAV